MTTEIDTVFVANVTYNTNRAALMRFFALYNDGQEPVQCLLLWNERRQFCGRVKLKLSTQEATDGLLQLSAAGRLNHRGRTLRATKWNRSNTAIRAPDLNLTYMVQPVKPPTEDRENEIASHLENLAKLKSSSRAANNLSISSVGDVKGLCDSCRVKQSKASARGERIEPIQSSCNCSLTFEKLPEDILLSVFDYLSLTDLLSVEQVSGRCEAVASRKWQSFELLRISEFGYSFYKPIMDNKFTELLRKYSNASLRKIDLRSGCLILSNTSMKVIGELCPNLVEFYLTSLTVGNKGIETLSNGCRKLKVVMLNDRNGQIGENGLWWLFHNCKDLEVVHIDSNYRLKGPCLRELGSKIKSLLLPHCSSLSDTGIKKLHTTCPQLERLDVIDCKRLSHVGFTSLSLCQSITQLDICGDHPATSRDSFRLLSNLSALTYLAMSENSTIDDSVIRDIARGCRLLGSVLISQLPVWSQIDYSATYPITSESVTHLARYCPKLRSLSMNHCYGVDAESTRTLARYSRELKHLYMRGCKLDTEGLIDLLRNCRKLELVDIMHCLGVGKRVVEAAVERATEIPSCELEMQLGGTEVTKDDFVDVPSNLILHFNDRQYSEADNDYYDEFTDDFIDYDDPLYNYV